MLTNESIIQYFVDNSFEDDLNDTVNCIVKVIRRNFNYLIAKSKKFQDDLYFKEFKKKILDELDNEYFTFRLTRTNKEDEIKLIIDTNS